MTLTTPPGLRATSTFNLHPPDEISTVRQGIISLLPSRSTRRVTGSFAGVRLDARPAGTFRYLDNVYPFPENLSAKYKARTIG
jgi:hypothetical protein